MACHAYFAAVLISTGIALSAQAQTWHSYSYPEDGFSISFPSQPKTEKQAATTSYSAEVDKYLYMAVVRDYGAQVSGIAPINFLRQVESNVVKAGDYTLTSNNPTKIGGYPALEYAYVNKNEWSFSARAILVGSKVYLLIAAYDMNDFEPPDEATFFGSFAIVGGEPPRAPSVPWMNFKSSEAGFSADWPDTPRLKDEQDNAKFTYTADSPVGSFIVQVWELDPAADVSRTRENFVRSAMANKKVVNQRSIADGSCTGTEFEFDHDASRMVERICSVRSHYYFFNIYQMAAAIPAEDSTENARRFLDSVQFFNENGEQPR